MGVERRYEAGGRVREAPDEAVFAVLRLLGAPVHGPEGVESALARLRRERGPDGLEPMTVSWSDAPPTLGLPKALSAALPPDAAVPFRIRTEGGETLEGRAHPVDGALPLPPELPDGVHAVELDLPGSTRGTTLLRAPRRCWSPDGPRPPRTWGAFLPLHALRTGRPGDPPGAPGDGPPEGDLGVGDTGDLSVLARWTRERGGSHVGTLPLLAAFLGPDGPVEPSPYVPASRLFWNEVHLDLARAPGLADVPEARERLASPGFREEAGALRDVRRADPVRTMALKRSVLEPLARALVEVPEGSPDRRSALSAIRGPDAFRQWLARRPDALDYARFRGDAGYHLYVQWAMTEQMDALAGDPRAADLYLDLPLGVHPEGFDVHARPELFATGARGGAPPDAFYEGGQDWGFPPLHPRAGREDGHDYLLRALAHSMAPAGMLRVDHVMSLHRLYWIPDGFGAKDGVYVRYPARELWALLCLLSHRHRCEVVGEDLGTVPPEVPEAMERHGALRMWVLPFEVHVPDGAEGDGTGEPGASTRPPLASEAHDPPARYTPPGAGAVASLETHDLPPFAAFWRGRDVDGRLARGEIDEVEAGAERAGRARWRRAVSRLLRERGVVEGSLGRGRADRAAPASGAPGAAPEPPLGADEALPALLRLLAASPARLLLLDLADLWLEEERQNVPGTAGPDNWTLRAARTVEALAADEDVTALLGELTALRPPTDGSGGA